MGYVVHSKYGYLLRENWPDGRLRAATYVERAKDATEYPTSNDALAARLEGTDGKPIGLAVLRK